MVIIYGRYFILLDFNFLNWEKIIDMLLISFFVVVKGFELHVYFTGNLEVMALYL